MLIIYKDSEGIYCLKESNTNTEISRIKADNFYDAKDLLIDYGVINEEESVKDETGESLC